MRLFLLLSFIILNGYVSLYSFNIDTTFKISGTVRSKYEYNIDSSISAFVVRNARYGVSGKLNPQVGFKAEIDLSDEGKIKMLDAYVNWLPINNLEVTLGQFKVPFSTDNIRSPHEIAFANRSFMSKRVSSELRDLGGMLTYNFKEHLPMKFFLGLFNGYGVNQPLRTEMKNYASRLEIEPIKNLTLSSCIYGGQLNTDDVFMYNLGFDYKLGNLVIDGEMANRNTSTDSLDHNIFSYFIYTQYHIPIDLTIFKYITPAVRYDTYEKQILSINQITSRITAGLTFTITKLNETHIKIDYENYFFQNIKDAKLDKISIEFMARF